MRAVVCSAYGMPEQLRLTEVARPVPKAGEVLIRVKAASLNSWDWDLLRGQPFLVRLGGLLRPPYPILGADVAGVVEAAGEGVTRFAVGDAVFGDLSGANWGGFAEYVAAPEAALAAIPAGVSFEAAAATPQAGLLAWQGLRWKGEVQPGDKVLINGGGGGAGTFAIQLAKRAGAEVTGVDRAEKAELMRSVGADRVIDYAVTDYTAEGERYDLILDMVAARPLAHYRRALSPRSRFVMVGGKTSTILTVALGDDIEAGGATDGAAAAPAGCGATGGAWGAGGSGDDRAGGGAGVSAGTGCRGVSADRRRAGAGEAGGGAVAVSPPPGPAGGRFLPGRSPKGGLRR